MKLKKPNTPFGWCPTEIINDPRISMKELGLWLYINSKPEGWDFNVEGICAQMADGKGSVKSALKSLEELGLLKREQDNKSGKFGSMEYTLKTCIVDPKRANQKTADQKSADGEMNTSKIDYSNIDLSKIDKEKKKKEKDSLSLIDKEEGAIHNIPEEHKQFKGVGSGQGMAEKLKLGEEVNELLNWWHSQINFRRNENNVKYVISAMGSDFSVGGIKKLVNFMLSHSEKDSNGYKRHNIVPSSLSRDEDLIYKWAGEYKSVRGGSLPQTKTVDYEKIKERINRQYYGDEFIDNMKRQEKEQEEEERQKMLNREPDF